MDSVGISATGRLCWEEADTVIHDRQESIEDIQMAEKNFQKMTTEKGIAEAFWFYADSNAVIKRENDTLIHGRGPFVTIILGRFMPKLL